MSAANLKLKTEKRPKSRISVEVAVPAERCKASFEDALSRLSRSVKLPGFRKGKVPKAVLLQRVGLIQIKATALESLVDGIWRESINQESLEPLCEPEICGGFEALLENFKPDEELSLTFETDIAPLPKLKVTKGLTAEIESIEYDPAKVDELIEQSRKQLATIVPVEDRPAKMGDIAVINFQGTYADNGNAIEGGSSDSMDIDLEKGRMIPGFIEGIIGMKLNDQKTVECLFPEDYTNEEARGRKANFEITLNDLKTRELPALDDTFAQQASDKKNLKELRKDLEERLREDASRRNSSNRQEALLKTLAEQLIVELPETLIQQEVRTLIEQTATNFAQQGMDVKSMFTPELVKSLMESSRPEAEENLRKTLAVSALAEAEGIKPKEEDIENKYKEVKQQLSGESKIDHQKLREAVIEDLLRKEVLEWLETNSTITETEPIKSIENKQSSAKSSRGKATSSQSQKSKGNTKSPSSKKPKE